VVKGLGFPIIRFSDACDPLPASSMNGRRKSADPTRHFSSSVANKALPQFNPWASLAWRLGGPWVALGWPKGGPIPIPNPIPVGRGSQRFHQVPAFCQLLAAKFSMIRLTSTPEGSCILSDFFQRINCELGQYWSQLRCRN
jgi:hypothetical protein